MFFQIERMEREKQEVGTVEKNEKKKKKVQQYIENVHRRNILYFPS